MMLTCSIRVALSVSLDPDEYFRVTRHGSEVQVERVSGHLSQDGSLHLDGYGSAIRKDGRPGLAKRHVYSLRAADVPDPIREALLDIGCDETQHFAGLLRDINVT